MITGKSTKRFLSLLCSLLIFTIFTGCGVKSDTNTPNSATEDKTSVSSELMVAGNEIAVSVDPTVYPSADYLLRIGAAEILFKPDAKGVIQPSLAKGAEQVDEHTWNIKLHPNVTFWSGDPVNAEAVIASLMRSKELDARATSFLDGIEFKAVDETTIQAVTQTPNLDVPLNLSCTQLVIHNTAEKYTYTSIDTADYTGMYRLVKFEPAQRMAFEKNENYWGKKPEIEKVVHEQISDPDARVLAALSGQYHVVMDIPQTAYRQFENSEKAKIVQVPSAQTLTVYLNSQKEALSDYRVRQALGWALDREELIRLSMEGLSEPVTTWLGSNPAYEELKTLFFDSYNIEKAAELMDEAGWKLGADGYRYKDGKQLSLVLRTFRNEQALGETIQMQWKKIGVNVSPQHGEYSLIATARETGEWDGIIEGWSTFGNVPVLLASQYAADGSTNYGHYQDEKVTDLLKKIEQSETEEEQRIFIKELSLHIAEKSPALYVCARPQLTAVSTSLEGFVPHFRQFENIVNADLRIK